MIALVRGMEGELSTMKQATNDQRELRLLCYAKAVDVKKNCALDSALIARQMLNIAYPRELYGSTS